MLCHRASWYVVARSMPLCSLNYGSGRTVCFRAPYPLYSIFSPVGALRKMVGARGLGDALARPGHWQFTQMVDIRWSPAIQPQFSSGYRVSGVPSAWQGGSRHAVIRHFTHTIWPRPVSARVCRRLRSGLDFGAQLGIESALYCCAGLQLKRFRPPGLQRAPCLPGAVPGGDVPSFAGRFVGSSREFFRDRAILPATTGVLRQRLVLLWSFQDESALFGVTGVVRNHTQ